MIPIALYFLKLPFDPQTVEVQALENVGGKDFVSTGAIPDFSFRLLESAAKDPNSRARLEGKTVTLIGQFSPTAEQSQFGLTRLKMACCAADAIPINAILMVNPEQWKTLPTSEKQYLRKLNRNWVEVEGRIYFFPRGNGRDYVSAVVIFPTKEKSLKKLIKKVKRPQDPFLQ